MSGRNSPQALRARRVSVVVLLMGVLAAIVALVNGATAVLALTVVPNVNVSRLAGNQEETAVAVDPTNPQRVFVVSNNDAGGLMFAFSTNAGATWTSRIGANGADGLPRACCDPSASWDGFGNLFVTYLDSNVATGSVHVLLSGNGGQTFTPIANLGAGQSDNQPTITTGAGSVWVTWTDGSDRINASGAAVTGFGAANIGAFSAPEMTGKGDFGDIAIGPTGAVMVTYQRPHGGTSPSTLFAALDPDGLGAAGFNAESAVVTVNMSGFYSIPAQSSRTIDPEPGLAWDRSGGAHNGRLYFVYANTPSIGSADTNIFVIFSDNNGTSWSSPVRVNDDAGTNSQFLQRIALDQTTGKIAVTWHDARNSATNTTAQFWGATSDDGTTFSANFQISAGTSNAATSGSIIDFGDYTGLAYQEGVFYPTWADNSNSTGDNPNGVNAAFDVYTAAVVVQRRLTTLTYNGDTSGIFHKPATLAATLTDTATGSPLAGESITFTLGTQSCAGPATTDAAGHASCGLASINQAPGTTTATATFGGDAIYAPSTGSSPFIVSRAASHIAYTGPTTADFHDSFLASAALTEDGGAPIVGRQVMFVLGAGTGSESCGPALTNGSGVATCPLTPNEAAGVVNLTAKFAGDAFFNPSSTTVPFTITHEETALHYTGPVLIPNGVNVIFSAQLKEDDLVGIGGGRPVTITIGAGAGAQSCTGNTIPSGVASCSILVSQPLGPGLPIKAAFLGDAFYLPSSDTATGLVFQFLASGTFVIGDGNAAVGGQVTYWGAQWSKHNVVSKGAAPNSFKGFVSSPSTTPPACGGTYTTQPGNSSEPPGSVPTFMAVVVSSQVTKNGSTISGNVEHIVIVRTEPGYGPSPGHTGTGTVVAQLC